MSFRPLYPDKANEAWGAADGGATVVAVTGVHLARKAKAFAQIDEGLPKIGAGRFGTSCGISR